MQTLPSNTSIFTDAGVSHRADAAYLHNKIIKCGHFSYENLPFDDTDRVIRIVCGVGNDTSHFIINTNIIYRAGDLGFVTHMEGIPNLLGATLCYIEMPGIANLMNITNMDTSMILYSQSYQMNVSNLILMHFIVSLNFAKN